MQQFVYGSVLTCVVALARAGTNLNDRPVIGIMVQPLVTRSAFDRRLMKYGSMYLPSSYVNFIEAAGARAAPVFYNLTREERTELFKQLSGLLIPGGHCGFHGTYGRHTNELIDMAKESNMNGDVFPVHGTCQGFQQLAQWAAGVKTKSVLSHFDSEQLLLPLEPLSRTSKWPPTWSWTLGDAPTEVVRVLAEENSTVNLHHWGVLPESFLPGGSLDNGVFRIVAISHDRARKPFVTLMEGSSLPFSATQYHPEKNAFEFGGLWNNDRDIGSVHSETSIAASQWLARQFVARARQSSHRWPHDSQFPLMKEFNPVPGGGTAGFVWESVYFWDDAQSKPKQPAPESLSSHISVEFV